MERIKSLVVMYMQLFSGESGSSTLNRSLGDITDISFAYQFIHRDQWPIESQTSVREEGRLSLEPYSDGIILKQTYTFQ